MFCLGENGCMEENNSSCIITFELGQEWTVRTGKHSPRYGSNSLFCKFTGSWKKIQNLVFPISWLITAVQCSDHLAITKVDICDYISEYNLWRTLSSSLKQFPYCLFKICSFIRRVKKNSLDLYFLLFHSTRIIEKGDNCSVGFSQ